MKVQQAILLEDLLEDRMLRIKEVCQMTGLSRSTIWRLERAGSFPMHYQLSSGRVGWKWSEIQSWIDSRQHVGEAA